MTDAIDRDQALAALKDAPGIWNFNDLEDGEPCITVADAVSLLESVAALPAIPLDREPPTDAQILYVAQVFHAAYEQEAKANAWDSQTPVPWDDLPEANVRTMLATVRRVWSMLPGALPVLETKKETE